MGNKSILKMLQYSPVAFAFLGLICGLIFSNTLIMGFACLGALLGAMVGIFSAMRCLLIQKNYVSMVSLAVNVVLFIVIAKEMQIIVMS